jgi:hypothetical protein
LIAAVAFPGIVNERLAAVGLGVHQERHAQLPQVREAGGGARLTSRPGERGEEDRDEQGDDRDDDQQLDKRERAARGPVALLLHDFPPGVWPPTRVGRV